MAAIYYCWLFIAQPMAAVLHTAALQVKLAEPLPPWRKGKRMMMTSSALSPLSPPFTLSPILRVLAPSGRNRVGYGINRFDARQRSAQGAGPDHQPPQQKESGGKARQLRVARRSWSRTDQNQVLQQQVIGLLAAASMRRAMLLFFRALRRDSAQLSLPAVDVGGAKR